MGTVLVSPPATLVALALALALATLARRARRTVAVGHTAPLPIQVNPGEGLAKLLVEPNQAGHQVHVCLNWRINQEMKHFTCGI